MVDMKSRFSAANLIKEFVAGRLTNDEFDEQYPDSEDRGVQTIGHVLWLSWDDRFTHRLESEYQLTNQQKALLDRCVAFLQTELEYTGPSAGGSAFGAAKGAWKRLLGKEQHVAIQGSLESPWWPFATEEQYRQYSSKIAFRSSLVPVCRGLRRPSLRGGLLRLWLPSGVL